MYISMCSFLASSGGSRRATIRGGKGTVDCETEMLLPRIAARQGTVCGSSSFDKRTNSKSSISCYARSPY